MSVAKRGTASFFGACPDAVSSAAAIFCTRSSAAEALAARPSATQVRTTEPTTTVASALMLITSTFAFWAAQRPARAAGALPEPDELVGLLEFLLGELLGRHGGPREAPRLNRRPLAWSNALARSPGPPAVSRLARRENRATVLLALAAVAVAGTRGRRPRGRTNGRWRCAPGPGTVSVDGRKPWGLAGGLDVEYGLTDAWAVRASFEASTHDVSKESDMDIAPGGQHPHRPRRWSA